MLYLSMLVEHTHDIFHFFTSLKVILDLDKVLYELNVLLMDEAEEFGFECSQVKDSYIQFLHSRLFTNVNELTQRANSRSLEAQLSKGLCILPQIFGMLLKHDELFDLS